MFSIGRKEGLWEEADGVEQLVAAERRLSTNTSRTMAAISLGFIVMVTPWTIQEVVAACTGSKVPPFLDFLATWLALSNSFWNPFLYWLLNSQFRLACREMFFSKGANACDSRSVGRLTKGGREEEKHNLLHF
ncbi:Uncharacterized protein GBIM_20791 [Gryllus bimaculatus]|nr:Uncharacterized protein GBIM_20791 [Gryllus bimaculatus]